MIALVHVVESDDGNVIFLVDWDCFDSEERTRESLRKKSIGAISSNYQPSGSKHSKLTVSWPSSYLYVTNCGSTPTSAISYLERCSDK